jgi:hypothetical protein
MTDFEDFSLPPVNPEYVDQQRKIETSLCGLHKYLFESSAYKKGDSWVIPLCNLTYRSREKLDKNGILHTFISYLNDLGIGYLRIYITRNEVSNMKELVIELDTLYALSGSNIHQHSLEKLMKPSHHLSKVS